jgi:hypothetical protein
VRNRLTMKLKAANPKSILQVHSLFLIAALPVSQSGLRNAHTIYVRQSAVTHHRSTGTSTRQKTVAKRSQPQGSSNTTPI